MNGLIALGAGIAALTGIEMCIRDSSQRESLWQSGTLCNAGKDAALPLAVKHGQVQQLLAFLQVLAGAHFGHAQFHLAEGVKVDLFLVGKRCV